MLTKRRFASMLVLSAAMTLSACGFHLRGSGNGASLPFKTIYIHLPDNSPLGVELRRYIRAGGEATIVNDPKTAEADLEPIAETRDKVIISRNTKGEILEYSLLYRFNFQVKDNTGKVLMPPTEISLKRSLTFNNAEALGKEKEEELLYHDMQTDLVQQILRRLSAIKPAAPSSQEP
jgi:LPS-assembly lipoprotein